MKVKRFFAPTMQEALRVVQQPFRLLKQLIQRWGALLPPYMKLVAQPSLRQIMAMPTR